MICHVERIKYKSTKDPIKIVPLFDIHYGNAACDVNALRDFIRNNKDAYFIGGGDWLDSVIISDLRRYRKTIDSTETDEIIDEQIDGLYEIIKPIKNRIIGLGSGNHEDNIAKRCGTHPMKRLCKRLDVPFLGFSGLIKLILRTEVGQARTVIIRWHHGWGGGSRTQGADLTKFSKDMLYWDADIFLYGHVHRKQADRIPRLGLWGDKLISKPKLLGICGTFLRTYTDTANPTYSEIAGYPPTEIGALTVNIRPFRKWVQMWIDT